MYRFLAIANGDFLHRRGVLGVASLPELKPETSVFLRYLNPPPAIVNHVQERRETMALDRDFVELSRQFLFPLFLAVAGFSPKSHIRLMDLMDLMDGVCG